MQSRNVIMKERALLRNSISCVFVLRRTKVKESESFG
jgi:hypothetical protein